MSLGIHAPRSKQCEMCFKPFIVQRMSQRVCSPLCAARWVKAAKAKGRRELRARKEKLKGRREWLAEAQQAVNKYVRLRDMAKGYGCISCGARPGEKFGGTMDAGHWRSVGSAPHLRYYLPQIALQCVRCNRYLSGHAVAFRRGLVDRLGLERVEAIEAMQGTAKWSIEYLKRLKALMAKKARRLEKRNA
jgi:hypothetical protein